MALFVDQNHIQKWRRGRVARYGSAKPGYVGAVPTAASKKGNSMHGFFFWFGVISFSLCSLFVITCLTFIIYQAIRTIHFVKKFKRAKTTREWLNLYDSLKRDDDVKWWVWGPYPIASRADMISGMRVMADEEEKGMFTCKICLGEFEMSEAQRIGYAYYCGSCKNKWERREI